jgi:hypothetical protein
MVSSTLPKAQATRSQTTASLLLSDTHYAVTDPEEQFAPFDDAQGRLRQGGSLLSCSQKICTLCKFFVNKMKQYHAAAGESGFHRAKRPGCMATV